jgi:hypothetical protein
MAAVGEGVGRIFARDVVFALHALGGEPHVHVDFRAMIDEPGAGGDFVAAARHHAHGSAPPAMIMSRRRNGCGRPPWRWLAAGTAEAVDGHAGDGVRQAGAQGHACGPCCCPIRLPAWRNRGRRLRFRPWATCGCFSKRRRMTAPARSSGREVRNAPRGALPTAVRRQSMMTASCMGSSGGTRD